MSDRQFLIIVFVLVLWLLWFVHLTSAYTTSEEELQYVTKEIEETICKTSFMCQYQRNVVDQFDHLIKKATEKEKEDTESLVPFPY